MFAASILSLFSVWDWLNIFGPVLVLAGVGGELWLLVNKLPKDASSTIEAKRHIWEVVAVLFVSVGVALELIVVPHSLLEVAGLNVKIEQLRMENIVLEGKMQDRTITQEQRDKFISMLKDCPKGSVLMGTRHPNSETARYFSKIESLLRDCGFTIQSHVNYPNNILWFNEGTSIGLVLDNTNDTPPYANGLFQAFNAIGLPPTVFFNPPVNQFGTDPKPGSNEVLIMVVEKP